MASNVHKYVGKKNPQAARVSLEDNATDVNGIYDEFRAPVPRTGGGKAAPNSGQTRRRSPSRGPVMQQQHGSVVRETGVPPFYETDASSIGADSDVPSRTHSHEHLNQRSLANQTNGHLGGAYVNHKHASDERLTSNRGIQPDYIQQPATPPLALNGPLSEGAMKLLRDEKGRNMIQTTYMEGDSYPQTTSGSPFSADSVEMEFEDDVSQALEEGHYGTARTQPLRGATNNLNVQNDGRQLQSVATTKQATKTMREGVLVRPDALNEGLSNHTAPPSAYDKVDKTWKAKQLNPKPIQQTGSQTVATRPTSTSNVARRATEATTDGGDSLPNRSEQNGVRMAHDHAERKGQHQPASIPKPRNREHTPPQHSNATAGEEHNEAWSGDVRARNDQTEDRAISQGKAGTSDRALDYEPTTLFKMSYHDLKAASFDEDPNKADFVFPSSQNPANLNDKLAAVTQFDQQEQLNFFTTLPVQEWEESGDWFITQFSEVLDKLRALRQRKRKAAKGFETEIEKRHVAVSKKRKQTDDELNEMKQSGVKVLQGTPKKTKTK